MAHTVTALHGFTGHPDDFEALWTRLPALSWSGPVLYGHDTVVPDGPDKEAWEETAASVAAGLRPQSILIGYSMGGRVALQVAIRRPDALAGLILIGATPGIADPVARAQRRAADRALAEHIAQVPLVDFLEEWSHKPIIASQQGIAEPYRGRMLARKLRLKPAGLARSLRGIGTGQMPSLWACLPTVPTLLLTGSRDLKFTRIAQQMAARQPRATHRVLPDVGHCAHLEAPDAAAAAIQDFLRALPHA